MGNLKRLSLMTALVAAVMALTAVTASADIEQAANPGVPYVGNVQGHNTGDNPTLVAGNSTVTCTEATTRGPMDGDWVSADPSDPANAVLTFTWDGCSVVQGTAFDTCTVNDVNDVDVEITEANFPDATIRNTETAGTQISCGLVFNCTATSDATTTPVTAEVESTTQVATIADTVSVSGLGCPSTGQWNAQYLISEPQSDPPDPQNDPPGASLDLVATGSP